VEVGSTIVVWVDELVVVVVRAGGRDTVAGLSVWGLGKGYDGRGGGWGSDIAFFEQQLLKQQNRRHKPATESEIRL
jgi:hypothetical protein